MLQDLGFSLPDEVGWRSVAARGVVPGVAKAMLCDHIITFRYTCLHVPIVILQSSRLGAQRRMDFKIQALGHAECDFEIEPWEYIPLVTDFLDILHGSGTCHAGARWWYTYQRWSAEMADECFFKPPRLSSWPHNQVLTRRMQEIA